MKLSKAVFHNARFLRFYLHISLDKCKGDHFCCLGRVPYGIRRYSTRYVRHGTITRRDGTTYTGMLLSRNGTKIGTVQDCSLYRTARFSASGACSDHELQSEMHNARPIKVQSHVNAWINQR